MERKNEKQYYFNNFLIYTEEKTVKLEEEIVVPTDVKNNKATNFTKKHKTKIITILAVVGYLHPDSNSPALICKDIFDFIDLIEILKAWTNKKVEKNKLYEYYNITARIAKKNGIESLALTIGKKDVFFDKVEAAALVSKFQKILSKCEPWQKSHES